MMDREAHEKLMADAKYKPGDIVWTNVKTYTPWPGKVLEVPSEILKIYPDESKIMHYIELYMKKDRDFHLEDELWPFEDQQVNFSMRRKSLLFHQAVDAAKREIKTGISEDIMDVENSASFCRTPFFRNNPRSADALENMQTNAMTSIQDKVDFVPSKRHYKNNSTYGKIQNKDLNSQDIYEFSESDPLDFSVGRRVLEAENVPETNLRSETSNMDISIMENIPQLDQNSESSLHIKPSLPVNNTFKRKMPLMEKVFESGINPELESVNKNIGIISPNVEPKLDNKSAPLDDNIKAKIPKAETVCVRRSGRKSKKRQCGMTHICDCDQTVQEKKSNVLIGKATISRCGFDAEIKVSDLKNIVDNDTKALFASPPVEEVVPNEAVEEVVPNEAVEQQPESKAQGLSSQIMMAPILRLPGAGVRVSIGFLGLGGLGKKIVRRLLADGYEVTLWNRSLYKTYEMLDIGALAKSTPEQVVRCCDVIFCCVSDTKAVKEVFYSSDGVLSGIRGGKSFVLLTTIDPNESLAIETAVKAKGGLYLEAPLFPAGGPIVDNALLSAAAGSRCCLCICIPFFRSFIKDFFYVGDVPHGTKLVVLMKTLSGVQVAALAESMALARKCDVPTDIFFQIIKQTQLASPFLLSKAEAMLEGGPWNDDDVFPLAHFSNDLTSALNLSDEVYTPVTAAAKQSYVYSKRRGHSDRDVSAVYLNHTEPY